MYRGYKIKAFIPAGRKKTMSVLFNYFEKNRDILDEVMIWENTENIEDIEWFRETERINPLYKCYRLPRNYRFYKHPVQYNTARFYEYTVDEDTIYIRFDDDIVFINDNYFKNILDFRIDNPDYFLVFGNIFNNAITSFIYQQQGKVDKKICTVQSAFCMDMCGWGNPQFAEYIHRELLNEIEEDNVKRFFFDDDQITPNGVYKLNAYRFSISNFAFFGKDFKEFPLGEGKMDFKRQPDEEIWLTENYPQRTGKVNVVLGNALVSHFTFSPYQKPHILTTDIYDQYKTLSERKLSEDYYKMLLPHN